MHAPSTRFSECVNEEKEPKADKRLLQGDVEQYMTTPFEQTSLFSKKKYARGLGCVDRLIHSHRGAAPERQFGAQEQSTGS